MSPSRSLESFGDHPVYVLLFTEEEKLDPTEYGDSLGAIHVITGTGNLEVGLLIFS